MIYEPKLAKLDEGVEYQDIKADGSICDNPCAV